MFVFLRRSDAVGLLRHVAGLLYLLQDPLEKIHPGAYVLSPLRDYVCQQGSRCLDYGEHVFGLEFCERYRPLRVVLVDDDNDAVGCEIRLLGGGVGGPRFSFWSGKAASTSDWSIFSDSMSFLV